jgi:ubiquinone/menaquinone biosynthesis C-methylase UbiE
MTSSDYWKKFLGIEVFKIDYYYKWLLYRFLGLELPKLKSQRQYWAERGNSYMNEFMGENYVDREIFFQDILIEQLKPLKFDSLFEAGCGFGWNIKRVKDEFPGTRIGGVDFSVPQLNYSKDYLTGYQAETCHADICSMPLKDNAYDIGISVGVFMNIHASKISEATKEMTRVCKKYIIHLEYDENNTTRELKKKRSFKTNIVSHDYRKLYEALGKEVLQLQTYRDFDKAYAVHVNNLKNKLECWEEFEGPAKYILTVIKV